MSQTPALESPRDPAEPSRMQMENLLGAVHIQFGFARVMEISEEVGEATDPAHIPPEKYRAVCEACKAALREGEMPDLFGRVFEFNRIGQTSPPGVWNADRLTFYTGMQLEELGEKILAIAAGEVDVMARERMHDFGMLLDHFGGEFKSGMHMGAVLRADGEKMLDADADILVVSAAAMMYQTSKFADAMNHVLDKNDAKFPDGVATRDENGKIMKPPGWTAPDLTPFIEKPTN